MASDKVTLYIATHNITGLKYFGRTINYFTEEDLQNNYHGSGVKWRRHLRKHGDDVTMEIYGIYSLDEVEEIAIKFSIENNIVESNCWANLIPKNGFGGGWPIGHKHSQDSILKMSEAKKERFLPKNTKITFLKNVKELKRSELTRMKISESKQGENNPNFNKEFSEEHKQKLSKAAQKKPYLTCPHCGKIGRGGSMKRWHFDNCKENINIISPRISN